MGRGVITFKLIITNDALFMKNPTKDIKQTTTAKFKNTPPFILRETSYPYI
jgi:hypothetical protein